MGLLILEALLALAVLLFIVWWTMFCGRNKGEPRDVERRGSGREARGPSTRPGRQDE